MFDVPSSVAQSQPRVLVGWYGIDGNDLLTKCKAAVDAMDGRGVSDKGMTVAPECLAFVGGFLDGIGASEKGDPQHILCFPEGVKLGQAVRVVERWLDEHPEKLHQTASACLFQALHSTFGCRPSDGR